MTTMFWTTVYDAGVNETTAMALVRGADGVLKEIRGRGVGAGPLALPALCMALYDADLAHLAVSLMRSKGYREAMRDEMELEQTEAPAQVVLLDEIEFFQRCPAIPLDKGLRGRPAKTLRTLKPRRIPEE